MLKKALPAEYSVHLLILVLNAEHLALGQGVRVDKIDRPLAVEDLAMALEYQLFPDEGVEGICHRSP